MLGRSCAPSENNQVRSAQSELSQYILIINPQYFAVVSKAPRVRATMLLGDTHA